MSNDNGNRNEIRDVDPIVNEQAKKEVAIDGKEIAEAISEYFTEMGTNNKRGFALFVVDFATGNINYISDINHDDAVQMIGMWVVRETK